MKKLLIFFGLAVSIGAFAQLNPAYNSIRLTGTDSTSFSVVDGTLRYDHTSNHFRGRVNGSWVSLDAAAGGAFWPLTGTGTLTGATTITTDAPNHLTYNGSWTTTADQDYAQLFGGTFTLRGTASDRFRGYRFAPTILAGANNQILEGLVVNPTFTPGAFTGLTQTIARFGSIASPPLQITSSNVTAFGGLLNIDNSAGIYIGTGGPRIMPVSAATGSFDATGSELSYIAAGGTNVDLASHKFSIGSVSGTGSGSQWGMQIVGTAGGSTGPMHVSALGVVITANGNNSSGTVNGFKTYFSNTGGSTGRSINHIWLSNNPSSGWRPNSGNNTYRGIYADYTINQTATATGDVEFIHYAPTITSVVGKHRSWYNSSGFHQWDNAISPSQITSNQTDYNPSGWNGADILRVNTDASRTINSLVGSSNGRLAIISNVGSNPVVLKDDDGSTGTAGYRFEAGTSDLTLPANTSVWAYYDGTSSRWRPIGKPGFAGTAGVNDNAIIRADGTGGGTIQSSGVTIDDSGNISLPGSISGTGNLVVQPGSGFYTQMKNYSSTGILQILNSGDVSLNGVTMNIDASTNDLTLQSEAGKILGFHGTGSNKYALSGVVHTDVTTTGNSGTTNTTLFTYTLPASYLWMDNDALQIRCSGTFAANTNGKQLRFYIGGTGGDLVFDTGSIVTVASAVSWVVTIEIIRTGSSAEKVNALFVGTTSSGNQYTRAGYTTGTRSWGSSQAIVLTGTATSNNDIVAETMKVKYEPTE